MEPTKLYVSSKLKRAQLWLDEADKYKDRSVVINSSWIYFSDKITEENYLRSMWRIYRREVSECDAFVLYVEQGDDLKGCLSELAMAYAFEKNMFVFSPDMTKEDLIEKYGTLFATVVFSNICDSIFENVVKVLKFYADEH